MLGINQYTTPALFSIYSKVVGAVGVEPTNPEGVSFTNCALWPLAYTPIKIGQEYRTRTCNLSTLLVGRVLSRVSNELIPEIGQSGGVRTHTVFSVPGRVASHMALTLMIVKAKYGTNRQCIRLSQTFLLNFSQCFS